jgi:hypothetical protein
MRESSADTSNTKVRRTGSKRSLNCEDTPGLSQGVSYTTYKTYETVGTTPCTYFWLK